MSKTLAKAALIVGAVALVASGVGAAAGAGIFGAVAAGSATAATLATIATVATIASVTAGVLTLASTLTAKKPSAQATGSQTSFSADPDAGIPYVIGRTGNAGNIVFRSGFDTADKGDNDRQAFVSVLSIGPVRSIAGQTVDRSPVGYSATGAAIGAFAGFMWSMTQVGALASPALGFGAGAGTPPGWTAQHKLSGLAAASWTLKFDTKAKLFQNGVPAPMWVVEGGFAYDPRKDSTYPGGNGPHRMADPADTAAYDAAVATWEYTENPFLHGLKWVHGIWQRPTDVPGSTWQRVMGMGAPHAGIDVPAFVEGANVADANGWKVGGVVFSRDDKWNTLKKILQAGMGEPLPLGARMSCLVNAPKVSLATITIADVIGEASVGATQPRRDRVNTITPRFRLEENNWQLLPGAPISVAEHVATDRGKRSKVLEYPFIQQTKQVATAVRYDIENAREFGPIVLPLKLVWMGYKPGDCVTVDLPELGLNGQPILLLNRELAPAGGIVTLTGRSETPGKHPFALGQTATPPPTPGVSGAPVVPVPADGAWSITGTELSANGSTVPALIVTGATDIGSAEAVIFEYRPFVSGSSNGTGWRGASPEPAATVRRDITSVAPGTAYEVAVSYQVRGVIGGRRILGPVTTSGTQVPWDGVTDPSGTRPDPNATNSADPNSPFGPIGTVGEAIVELAKLPDISADLDKLAQGGVATDEALQALTRAGVDRDGAQRLLARGGDMLAEAALRLTLDSNRRAVAIRDAGIVIEPATGKARLYAVEEALGRSARAEIALDAQAASIRTRATYADLEMAVAQAQLEGKDIDLSGLYGRVSDVEVEVDGLAGQIALRATTAELSALGLTVGEIEQTLDSLGDVVGVTTDVRLVRQASDEAARAILGGLVSQDRAGRDGRTAIVQARQELTARMDDRDAIEARARTVLGVALGEVDARLVAESRARIAAGEVAAEDIRALSVTTGEQAGAIADLSRASIEQGRGLTVVRSTQRQQVALDDQTAEGLLASLIAGDRADRRARLQLVQVQSEQTTEMVREKLSRAAERVALDARLGASEASAARSAEALAEADRAAARTVQLLAAEIDDPATGLVAAHASIGKVEEVVVGPAGASARAVTVLDVNGRVTGTYNTTDGITSAFGVVADKFGVYHPTTGALLFYVDVDGAIAASFKASAIGYDHLAMGAAQKAAFFPLDGDVVIPRGSTAQVVSLTFVKEDTDSLLKVMFNGDFSSPDDLQFTGSFTLDGAVIKSTKTNITLVGGNAAMPITPFVYRAGVAAGQHTIAFTATNTESDAASLTIAAGSVIEVTELRKASIGSSTGSGGAVVPGAGTGGSSGGGGSGGYNGGGRPPVAQQ